jgi:methionyl aminopeptidase
MSITILGPREIQRMREAGRCAAATLAAVAERLRAGITTADIDAWVRSDTAARGATPSQLGFHGFPAAVCTSVNEVVCHGVPGARVLRDGDIVNVDVTSDLAGWHGDTSATFEIGSVSLTMRALVDATRRALAAGIAVVRPGARLGDIAAAIGDVARPQGYGVVREYCGHGIGRAMHQPPQVCHVGRAGTGLRLRAGMAFTIEPMLTIGDPELRVLDDGWTVVTCDGSPSAQFEHTVLVTNDGCEVLTLPPHERRATA